MHSSTTTTFIVLPRNESPEVASVKILVPFSPSILLTFQTFIPCWNQIGNKVIIFLTFAKKHVPAKSGVVQLGDKKGQTWEMGRGVIDFRPILKVLRQIKYQGVISLEFEKNSRNPHAGVAESIGYLRGIADGTK